MAVEMWDSHTADELQTEFTETINSKYSAFFIACEMWAKDMGCTEFASDCELDNTGSLKFHIAMGFVEANRIICFKKNI